MVVQGELAKAVVMDRTNLTRVADCRWAASWVEMINDWRSVKARELTG